MLAVEAAAGTRLRLLHRAVHMLAASADEQVASLPGTVVTDELALDFDNAWAVLPALQEDDGVVVDRRAMRLLERLHQLLAVPSGSDMWSDEALPTHPTWHQVRVTARAVQSLLSPLG